MKIRTTGATILAALLLGGVTAGAEAAEQEQPCPLHAKHQEAATTSADHHAGIDQRGDGVMGFSHQRTVHHFLKAPEGGTIQVEVTDSADTESLQQIRSHLAEVARQFSAGDFSMPREIHDRILPGVPVMIERKEAIAYRYEEMEHGGRVVIRTADPEAVAAIHAFLEAQIGDHRTGDPMH